MCRIIACIASDCLATILRSPVVIDLQEFINFDMPEHVLDRLWSEDEQTDLVIIDRGPIDYDDVSNSAKSNPSTSFFIREIGVFDSLPPSNMMLFRDEAGLAQALFASARTMC